MYSVTRGLRFPTYRWALFGASAGLMPPIEFILYSRIERDDKRGMKETEVKVEEKEKKGTKKKTER
jgi:hypothetical protein